MASIFILAYTKGEYSNYSEQAVAAFIDKEAADEMCSKMNAIAKFFIDEYKIYKTVQRAFASNLDETHPSLYYDRQTGKNTKEWKERDEYRNNAIKNFNEQWWGESKNRLLLKDPQLYGLLSIYPAHNYDKPEFLIEELPVWHPMA